jgi:hypothetical protein
MITWPNVMAVHRRPRTKFRRPAGAVPAATSMVRPTRCTVPPARMIGAANTMPMRLQGAAQAVFRMAASTRSGRLMRANVRAEPTPEEGRFSFLFCAVRPKCPAGGGRLERVVRPRSLVAERYWHVARSDRGRTLNRRPHSRAHHALQPRPQQRQPVRTLPYAAARRTG